MLCSSPCPGHLLCLPPLLSLSSFLHKFSSPRLPSLPSSFFLHQKCRSCRRSFIVLPPLPVPIRPCPDHRPSIHLRPRHPPRPPLVVDCCIHLWIFISISSPFQTVFQFWAAVPQCKRGRRCLQFVRMKDEDEGRRYGQSARMRSMEDRQRAWTTEEEHG